MRNKILVIDDNPTQRGTVVSNLQMGLEDYGSDLEVIEIDPFHKKDDYFKYIDDNDVCVLILDEKLNDQQTGSQGPVDYKGSELIVTLREKFKELPIFAMTIIPADQDLRAKYSYYEDIIRREDFYATTENYIPKFCRAAMNYLRSNTEELEEFNRLSILVAQGDPPDGTLEKLHALQVKLVLPVTGFETQSEWLDEYEQKIKDLENLKNQIENSIKKS